MNSEIPRDLRPEQQERWRQGIGIVHDVAEGGELRRAHLAAHSPTSLWEYILRCESGALRAEGPSRKRPGSDDDWYTFDLQLKVKEISWSLLCGLVESGIVGAEVKVPQMRVVDGICKPMVTGRAVELSFTVPAQHEEIGR